MSAGTENYFSNDVLTDYYENQKSQRILDQLEADEERERFCNLVSILEKNLNDDNVFSNTPSSKTSASSNMLQQQDIQNFDNQVSSKIKDFLPLSDSEVNVEYFSLNSINNNFQMDAPNYEDILPTLYDRRLNNRLIKFGSESKINQLENNSVLQLKLFKDFQAEVMQSINEIKNRLILAESNYIIFLQQIELKRILLDKEQNLLFRSINLLEEELAQNEFYTQKDINEDDKYVEEERQKLFDIKEAKLRLEDSLGYCSEEEISILKKQLLQNQEAEENQCFILDNLEFQLLEKKTQREEAIDESLKQKNIILNQCEDLQIKLMNILTKKSEISKTVSKETSEFKIHQEHLSHLMNEEVMVLHKIKKQIEIQEQFYKRNIKNLTKQHATELDVNLSYTRIRNLSKTLPRLNLYKPFENSTIERNEYTSGINSSDNSPRYFNQNNYSPRYEDDAFYQHMESPRYILNQYNVSTNSPRFDNGAFYPPLNMSEYETQNIYEHKDLANFNDNEMSYQNQYQNNPKYGVGLFYKQRNSPLIEDLKTSINGDECDRKINCLCDYKNVDTKDYIIEPSPSQSHKTVNKEELSKNLRENECKLILEKAQRLKFIETQTCPVTRYLTLETDLADYISNCGHNIEQCNYVTVTKNACRGHLVKMTTSILRPTWKKRWFVFDQNKRNLSYYSDRNEIKATGIIYFQSIEDVFVDHLHQVKSPVPQLTFCLKTQQRMFYLVAPTADSLRLWLDVLLYTLEGIK